MGLFGRQAHVEEEEDEILTTVSSEKELPVLPEPPNSTVVAAGSRAGSRA